MSKSSMIFKMLSFSEISKHKLVASLKHSLRIARNEKEAVSYKRNHPEPNLYKYLDKNGDRVIYTDGNEKVYKDNRSRLFNNVYEQGNKKNRINKNNILEEIVEGVFKEGADEFEVDKVDKKVVRSDLSMAKRDIKRFLKTDNKNDHEFKETTQAILDYLETGNKDNVLLNSENISKYQEAFPRRQKKLELVLNDLEVDNEIKKSNNGNNNRNKLIESFLKLPLNNGVELTPEESGIIQEDYYTDIFNYDTLLICEHNDELYEGIDKSKNKIDKSKKLGGHSSAFVHTLNKETGLYDYSEKRFELGKKYSGLEFDKLRNEYLSIDKKDIKDWLEEVGKTYGNKVIDPIIKNNRDKFIEISIGKEARDRINKRQKSNLGRYLQESIFEYANNHRVFKDKKIEVEKYVNVSIDKQEAKKLQQVISEDTSKVLNERLNNGYTYTQKLDKVAKRELDTKNKELAKTKRELEKTQNINLELKDKVEVLEIKIENTEYEYELKSKELETQYKKDTEDFKNKTVDENNELIRKVNKYREDEPKLVKKVEELTEKETKLNESISKFEEFTQRSDCTKIVKLYDLCNENTGYIEEMELSQKVVLEEARVINKDKIKQIREETQKEELKLTKNKIIEEKKLENLKNTITKEETKLNKIKKISNRYEFLNKMFPNLDKFQLKKNDKKIEEILNNCKTDGKYQIDLIKKEFKELLVANTLKEQKIEDLGNDSYLDTEIKPKLKGIIESFDNVEELVEKVEKVVKSETKLKGNVETLETEKSEVEYKLEIEKEDNILYKENYKNIEKVIENNINFFTIRGVKEPEDFVEDYIKTTKEKKVIDNENIGLKEEVKGLRGFKNKYINKMKKRINGIQKHRGLKRENTLLETENTLLKKTINNFELGFNFMKDKFNNVKEFFGNKEEKLSIEEIEDNLINNSEVLRYKRIEVSNGINETIASFEEDNKVEEVNNRNTSRRNRQ